MASKSTGNGKKGPMFTKGGAPGPGRPKGSHDSVPRSVKAVCTQILEEDGDLVREAIRRGLAAPPPTSAPYVKLVVDHGLGKPVDKVPERRGPGLTIVLTNQQDPLADRSRPTPPIDLTMGGAAVNAEPPSRPAKALPPAAAPKPQRTAGPAKNKLPKQLRDEDGQDYVMMEEPEFEPEPDNTGPRWTGPRNRGREDW